MSQATPLATAVDIAVDANSEKALLRGFGIEVMNTIWAHLVYSSFKTFSLGNFLGEAFGGQSCLGRAYCLTVPCLAKMTRMSASNCTRNFVF